MDVICVGISVADAIGRPIDVIPEKARLALFDRMELHSGGCALNSAIALAKLGVSTGLISKVGNDGFGDFLLKECGKVGVDTRGVVQDEINPALQRLAGFLDGDYRAAAPAGVGISQYPGGADYYRYLARFMTTMETTPEEVQEIGVEMVVQMQEAMTEIRNKIGWEGTREEFHEELRTNPQFFPKSPDEVAARLQSAADEMWAGIDRLFIKKPEARYGVRRLHPALEPSQTYGHYSPPTAGDPVGYYNYNGSKLHELVPGHHLHIARQQENDALPAFRTSAQQTAYTEGWGSYSSFLGLEGGVFDDDLYSEYGFYVAEIFLATRLVVDPGMNVFGWSLERARDYMRDVTLESATQIDTESLRYSTDMPGQALAYQMGKRKLLDLRAKAESELGDAFDIRRFHEAVQEPGSMPMTVLEKHIDWFIEHEKGARP